MTMISRTAMTSREQTARLLAICLLLSYWVKRLQARIAIVR